MTATALLDTGATVSGIGPRVINQLALLTSGKNRLGSATDEAFVDYYLFRLGLFSTDQLLLDQLGPGDLPFLFDEIDGFSWSRATDFDVILGMDVVTLRPDAGSPGPLPNQVWLAKLVVNPEGFM